MAKATIEKIEGDSIYFRLANRPQYLCIADSYYFYKFIENSNSWRIKEESCGLGAYIAKSVHNKNKNKGKKNTSRTYFFHWEVFGEEMRGGSGLVIDHKNRNKLDNRRENLRKVDLHTNAQNASGTILHNYAKKNGFDKFYYIQLIEKLNQYRGHFKGKYLKASTDLNIVLEALREHRAAL